MKDISESFSYSSKYKQKYQTPSLPKKNHNYQARNKIKLDPLQLDYLTSSKTMPVGTKASTQFSTEKPSLYPLDINSKVYETAIRKHLGIPLISRESEESEETPLIKIITQTPCRFRSKFSDFSISAPDSPKPLIKTEVRLSQKDHKKRVNFSVGSELELKSQFSPEIQGSLEELRLLLKKVKNS